MRSLPAALLTILVLLGAASPAAAAPQLLPAQDFTVTIPGAQRQACATRSATGAGVDRRTFVAPVDGTITAQLSGDDGSDFDLAVVDAASNGVLSGSAAFRSTEVVTTLVGAGQALVVQTCRRTGPSATANLRVFFTRTDPAPPPSEEGDAAPTVRLLRVALREAGDAERLAALGLDTSDHPAPDHWDVLVYSDAEQERLRAAGFTFRVREADVLASDRANRATERRAFRNARARAAARAATPSGRTTYRTLQEHQEELKALVEQYPNVVRPVTLPLRTWEGREITGIEIAQDVNRRDDGRPVYFQLGTHHAREWPANEAAMEFGIELVRNFVRDPGHLASQPFDERRARIVREGRTIVIPIINVDGFDVTIQTELAGGGNFADPIDSGDGTGDQSFGSGAYKRKNCRPVDTSEPYVPCLARSFPLVTVDESGEESFNDDFGVDPNRNYGVEWGGPGTNGGEGPEGETFESSLVFSGPAPFSEPEIEGFRRFSRDRQPTMLITNHTFTGLMLRPPGTNRTGPVPDEERLRALGDAMAAATQYLSQYAYQLYDVTGSTDDYMYDGLGSFSYTPEIGKEEFHPAYTTGFIPEYDGREELDIYGEPTGRKLGGLREAYTLAGLVAIDPQSHSVLQGTAPPGRTLRIRKTISYLTSDRPNDNGFQFPLQRIEEPRESTMVVRPDGTFSWHVSPSRQPRDPAPTAWRLTCEDDSGRVLETRDIHVERAQVVELGLRCGAPEPAGGTAPSGAGDTPGGTVAGCDVAKGFRYVDARRRGRKLRIRFGREVRARVRVDVLQVARGRTTLRRQRLVRRFSRTVSFTWNGRNTKGRRVADGVYVLRFSIVAADGRTDVRRLTVTKRKGRFTLRGTSSLEACTR